MAVVRKGTSWGVVVVVAILAGALGPRFTWPRSVAADAPFAYVPPPGFVAAEGDAWKAIQAASPAIRQGWYVPATSVETSRPTLNVMHAPQTDPVEIADLEALAAGMPDVAAKSESTWKTVRVTRELRRDGARVGWVEGAAQKGDFTYRSIELVFPDDDGTSYVTGMIPEDQMDKWSPLLEASVQSATGVARRFGDPPVWMHLAWAAGGALLALLAGGIVQRREREVRRASEPAPPLPIEAPASLRLSLREEEPLVESSPVPSSAAPSSESASRSPSPPPSSEVAPAPTPAPPHAPLAMYEGTDAAEG